MRVRRSLMRLRMRGPVVPEPMVRCTARAAKPSEQTIERELCSAQIVAAYIDMAQAERELAHANEQLAIQSRYPGRRQ
jgi:hypothetical protein